MWELFISLVLHALHLLVSKKDALCSLVKFQIIYVAVGVNYKIYVMAEGVKTADTGRLQWICMNYIMENN